MIRNVKSNFIILTICFLLCGLYTPTVSAMTMPSRITLQDNGKAICKITVRKSTGEAQKGVYAKLFGHYGKFESDEHGVIQVEYTNSSYSHTATLYFNGESESNKKSVDLDTEKNEMTVYFDRLSDIQEYKRVGRLFPVEGMLVDPQDNPIEGAVVSIQGTGRRTTTDEMGLFKIDADFIHTTVIRADGMDNLSLPIGRFFQGEEGFKITMHPKNGWEVYGSAEKMPEFPGGMQAFQDYLKKNLVYPEKAKRLKKEGVVVIQFVVETNGTITNPRIARHLEESLDSTAYELVKSMPLWLPATDFGTKVRCKYSLPIAFKIPKPKPQQPIMPITPSDSTKAANAIAGSDSLHIADSLANKPDSKQLIAADSLANKLDGKQLIAADSLQQDSTLMITDKDQPTVKVKKRNAFIRFFRWLFGIERRQRKRAEREMKEQNLKEAMQKIAPNASVELSGDSVKIHADSVNIDLNALKAVKE